MANSSLVYRSSITTSNIKKSLSGLETGIKNSQKTSSSISQSLIRRNEQKRQALSVKSTLFLKRREAVRRREQEDIIEAGSVFGGVRRTQRVVMNSTKGFMGRILDYIGTLLVGWAVINLPTIISLAKQLGTRIQKLTGILATFMSDTKDFMLGFGQLLGGVFQNVISFDFTDSQGRLTSALSQMKQAFERMEDSIYDGIILLTKPIDFGIPEGGIEEEQQQPGTQQPGTPPPAGPGGGKQNRATRGTKEQRALLDAISFAEGTTKSYGVVSGGAVNKKLEEGKLTVQEVINLGNSYGRPGSQHKWSGATGRYQFMPFTLSGLVARGQLKANELFTPARQDEAAIMLIERRGVSADMLRKQGMSVQIADLLAPEFASFPYSPTGRSYYNQSFKPLSSIQQAYQKSLGSQQTPAQTTPAPTTPIPTGKVYKKNDDLTNTIGKGVSYIKIGDVIGAPRGNGRKHKGIDILCPSGTYIALRLDSEVVFAGWQNPNNHNEGYGLVIDLWVPELGVQLRFGHCSGFLVNSGKIKAGRSFARVGSTGNSTGPHIHFEYTKNRNQSSYGSDGDPSSYIPYILLTNKPNNVPFSTPANTTAAAPGSITIDNVQSQQRRLKGETKDNVITVPLQSSQQKNTAMLPVGGAPGVNLMSDDELNRFITQKLLLDLAYT